MIVPKADDAIRVCVDFRKVNEVVAFDIFPMPQIKEMLEKIVQARYILTLDLIKGYWQISMNERDK